MTSRLCKVLLAVDAILPSRLLLRSLLSVSRPVCHIVLSSVSLSGGAAVPEMLHNAAIF